MQNSETLLRQSGPQMRGEFYRAFWRWHFYAALFVVPFLLLLCLSGMLMLATKPAEALLNRSLLQVEPLGKSLPGESMPLASQLAAVQQQYPEAVVRLYIPPRHKGESARFSLVPQAAAGGHGGHNVKSTTVYLNPYNGEILGTLDPAESLYASIKSFHSTLYLGPVGETLIEIAAGLAVLMELSGLYLAWPREGWRTLLPRRGLAKRESRRRLHRFVGLLVCVPLLFFLVSGLAWSNIWGGKLTQAWSSLPGTSFKAPQSDTSHKTMNESGLHRVPWVLEQTPLPGSRPQHNDSGVPRAQMNLTEVTRIAAQHGFDNYRVHLPNGDDGVWTISATTIAGDLTNPLGERILHLDRYDGRVLADIRFADYPVMGKAMAASIPLHQGDLGGWNIALNLTLCAMVIAMIVTGLTLWWLRRPRGTGFSLAPPPAPPVASRVVVILMVVVALGFPLSALALIGIALLDRMLILRFEQLQARIK